MYIPNTPCWEKHIPDKQIERQRKSTYEIHTEKSMNQRQREENMHQVHKEKKYILDIYREKNFSDIKREKFIPNIQIESTQIHLIQMYPPRT